MNVLLDTTIQINRMFKPKEREAIKKFIRENECYCSSYVLGEFKANIVNDFTTLYDIMQLEDNLTDVYQGIADIYTSQRSQTRMLYIVNDLAREFDQNLDLIKETLETYPERLLRRFYYGIHKELLDQTGCSKANAQLEQKNGTVKLEGLRCRKTDERCKICEFWKEHKEKAAGLENNKQIPQKMVPVLELMNNKGEIPKGNNCRSMGDCIIALESLSLEDGNVASTNIKDFAPICEHIGARLVEIQSSDIED